MVLISKYSDPHFSETDTQFWFHLLSRKNLSSSWHDCNTFIFKCFLSLFIFLFLSGVPSGDAFIRCDGVYGGRGAHRRCYRDRYEGRGLNRQLSQP